MGFENIFLPKSIIADLYKNNLVELITIESRISIAKGGIGSHQKDSLQFLGGNLKNILLLVHYPANEHLPDKQLDFLNRILKACNLKLEDIAIINTARQQANESDINKLNIRSILIFGDCISPILNNITATIFIPVHADGITIFTSPSLDKLDLPTKESKDLKNQFWVSLQQFFRL